MARNEAIAAGVVSSRVDNSECVSEIFFHKYLWVNSRERGGECRSGERGIQERQREGRNRSAVTSPIYRH